MGDIGKEEDVSEVCVLAHSSFRICILYTPKSRSGKGSLRLENQSFYLLFELHSLKDYGEISLFCTAETCGCLVDVTKSLDYQNCLFGEQYEETMELTNYVCFLLVFECSVI